MSKWKNIAESNLPMTWARSMTTCTQVAEGEFWWKFRPKTINCRLVTLFPWEISVRGNYVPDWPRFGVDLPDPLTFHLPHFSLDLIPGYQFSSLIKPSASCPWCPVYPPNLKGFSRHSPPVVVVALPAAVGSCSAALFIALFIIIHIFRRTS